MKTIKLPFTTDNKSLEIIQQLRKQLSPIIRYSYKRSMNGTYRNHIYQDVRNKWPDVDSWFTTSAINDAIGMAAADKKTGNSRIFGGKANFFKRSKGKISKSEWQDLRLLPLSVVGEACKTGNRKFELDLVNNRVIFKVSKDIKLSLTLPKIHNNYKTELLNLKKSAEQSLQPYSIHLTDKHICFSFDEIKLTTEYKSIETRHAGIDLNPNYIGFTIFDGDTRLFSRIWKLSELTINDSNQQSYLRNKMAHEVSLIAKQIQSICCGYNVSLLSLEKLSIKSKDHNKGKKFNRLVNNVWNRRLAVQLITKRCAQFMKVKEVHPAYSSFIGNVVYQLPDPISAACEISRRGYKRKEFYPKVVTVETLKNLWKEEVEWDQFKTWPELFTFIKNSKMRYRVPLPDNGNGFQNFMSSKSLITTYNI